MATFTLVQEQFGEQSAERKPQIKLMWGATELDRSKTNFWDPSYKGDIIFDPKFSENFHTT